MLGSVGGHDVNFSIPQLDNQLVSPFVVASDLYPVLLDAHHSVVIANEHVLYIEVHCGILHEVDHYLLRSVVANVLYEGNASGLSHSQAVHVSVIQSLALPTCLFPKLPDDPHNA